MVRGILKRTFGPASDIDDLQQDIFLAFFRKVPGLRDPEALEAFVAAITSRMIKYEFRRRKHAFVTSWGAQFDTSPEQDVPDDATVDIPARRALFAFSEVLDLLSPKDQMFFNLRFIKGLSLPEVAAAAGVSVSTTKRQLARVRKLVGQRLRTNPALADYASRMKARVTPGAWRAGP
jgi:RNA polymerase sigma-70 factor (ECF subfamily)